MGHRMYKCPNIEPGQATRAKLKEKNRCDACYTHKNEHTELNVLDYLDNVENVLAGDTTKILVVERTQAVG